MTSTMPDNDTLVYASTDTDSENIYLTVEKIVFHISLALTIAALAYGVTSWIILKKFRHYRNYVFLNLILQNFFTFIFYYGASIMVTFMSTLIILGIFLYLAAAKLFWMIVICHMFYVDIVKVFDGHIRRKYLKSALFGWGASLIYSITQIGMNFLTGSMIVSFLLMLFPLILNTILYFVTICSLFRSSNASANTRSNKCRLFFIASLIFMLSDGLLISTFLLQHFKSSRMMKFITSFPNRLTTSIILNIYLVVVKGNRELWYEFYVKKRNERQRNRDIQMKVKNVRENAVSAPAVINVEN